MKATLLGLSALLVAALASSKSHAQLPCPSCSSQGTHYMPYSAGYAPNFYGAPSYGANCCGGIPAYGAGYGGMPPQPFGGVRPPAAIPSCCSKIMAFPVNPYTRSPRDYFMLDLECCGTHY